MANRYRGEIDATIDGKHTTLCLTLGTLAELESELGVNDLVALSERLSSGHLSAQDMMKILAAGLRGAGGNATSEDVANMQFDGGISGAAGVTLNLLTATFSMGEEVAEDSASNPPQTSQNGDS